LAGVKRCVGGIHPLRASREVVELIGNKATLASLVVEKPEEVKLKVEKEVWEAKVKDLELRSEQEVGELELLLDNGQGKTCVEFGVHDRARRKRRKLEVAEARLVEGTPMGTGAGAGLVGGATPGTEEGGGQGEGTAMGTGGGEKPFGGAARSSSGETPGAKSGAKERKISPFIINDDDTATTEAETSDEESLGEEEEQVDDGEPVTVEWSANPPLHWGLEPPRVGEGVRVSGVNKRQLRRENKAKRI
jgi:hypothetical protein